MNAYELLHELKKCNRDFVAIFDLLARHLYDLRRLADGRRVAEGDIISVLEFLKECREVAAQQQQRCSFCGRVMRNHEP